jgi:hypothetical protein
VKAPQRDSACIDGSAHNKDINVSRGPESAEGPSHQALAGSPGDRAGFAQLPTTNTQLVVPLPPMLRVAKRRAPGTCVSPAVPVTCL